jgi:hypothetical protein
MADRIDLPLDWFFHHGHQRNSSVQVFLDRLLGVMHPHGLQHKPVSDV